jgi:Ca2+-binding EF-hand superfamily protein
MKSKYKKIKYTNTGVKAPVVIIKKSNPDLNRSDMLEVNYPEMIITIRRMLRKTMYNRAKSLITVESDHFIASFHVYDTINDARVVCENLYLIIKKPELDFRITTREYDSIYDYMKEVIYNAKES